MKKLEGPDVRRVLQDRKRSVRAYARACKDAAESGLLDASRKDLARTRMGMWSFTPVRKEMVEEIDKLAVEMKSGREPEDLDVRVMRVSLAMYFIDKLEEMLNQIEMSNSAALASMFGSAGRAVGRILDESFFSKTPKQIINDYLDGEHTLAGCAEACSVSLLTLEQAVKEYKSKVAQEVDQAAKKLPPPNIYIPI
ncbi:hypothetical protein GF318_04105 [Candidatus Micrarchaeota archaeon]|nr:hypothetical protein [Candidatus Micrarchaeota archaeon]